MSDDQAQTLRELKDAVARIERGMFGDKAIGHKGLVGTQQEHAGRIGRLERAARGVYFYLAGAVAVVGLAYKVATDWWHK